MKQIRYWSMMLVVVLLPLLVACSNGDDDDYVSLNSYIVGTWHSFKASGYGNGQNVTVEVTKTGDYSAMYMEVAFENGNKAIMRGWVADQNGISHWEEEPCSYVINGDIVKLIDSSGNSVDLVFDTKDKTLLLKGVSTTNGVQIYVNIYFAK